MDKLKQFQDDAIRTESTVPAIEVNLQYLASILDILICAGNLLDQLKKNIFYDKPIDPEERAKFITGIIAAMDSKALFIEDPTASKEIMDVNTRLFHSIIGISTESTELLENLVTGNIDITNMLEEFVDLDWYKAVGCDATGANWQEMLDTLIEKLKSRYGDKFSSDGAINRDVDAEREILDTMTYDNKNNSN